MFNDQLLERYIESVNVAGEPGNEEIYPLQPALSEGEIDAAIRAATTASTAMRQELMDAPGLDLAQDAWWRVLRIFHRQCRAAGRCLGCSKPRLGPTPPEPVVAAYEEFACDLGHPCRKCPCGQFREWVQTLADPKTARVGVAEIAARCARTYAAWVREQSYARLRALKLGEAYTMGVHADQAEADAYRAQELVDWERRYANASDEERRKMVEQRKADAFDRVLEAHMD
jgi:hypothetical protein